MEQKEMNDFKLLAIRPRKGCSKELLKNLQEDVVYQFYKDYELKNDNGNERFEKKQNCLTNCIDLYSTNKMSINVSAIVGQNGSGKSSLLDFLNIICYAIANEKDILINLQDLNDDIKIQDANYYDEATVGGRDTEELKRIDNISEGLKQKKEKYKQTYKNVCVDLFYWLDNQSYKISFNNGELDNSDPLLMEKFFYNVILNYSLYGLNSKYSSYIEYLFIKNDGYQTPITLNPYRSEGIIDVNSEYTLTQSRILSNLRIFGKEFQIIKGKTIETIQLIFEPELLRSFDTKKGTFITKFAIKNNQNEFSIYLTNLINKTFPNQKDFSETLLTSYLNILQEEDDKTFEYKDADAFEYVDFQKQLIKYLIIKTIKICKNYRRFNGFCKDEIDGKNTTIKIINQKQLAALIYNDKSHITLKIRQTLFILKMKYFENKLRRERSLKNSYYYCYTCDINPQELKEISEMVSKDFTSQGYSEIDFMPVACFKIDISVKNKTDVESNSKFVQLSSGESQLINIVNTITYHLLNLNSVFSSSTQYDSEEPERPKPSQPSKDGNGFQAVCVVPNSDDKIDSKIIKYKQVNIVLDEIELYFHPEYQRIFLSELIRYIEAINIPHIKAINILFSTHSPFILSDISASNILLLKDGKPEDKEIKTFGANIHDILRDSFFLENGAMGEFAKGKINEVISWLHFTRLKNDLKTIEQKQIDKKRKDLEQKYFRLQIKDIKKQYPQIEKLTIEYCNGIIQLIDEPLLKRKVQELAQTVLVN